MENDSTNGMEGRENGVVGEGVKDKYTIGEVVAQLQPEFPSLSVSKVRYLERRRLINLSRTRGGYRLFSSRDVELLKYILTLQDKEYLPLKVIKKAYRGWSPHRRRRRRLRCRLLSCRRRPDVHA